MLSFYCSEILLFCVAGLLLSAYVQCGKNFTKMKIPALELAVEGPKEGRDSLYSVVTGIGIIRSKKNAVLSGDLGAIIFDYIIGSTLWDFHVFQKVIDSLSNNMSTFLKIYDYIGIIDSAISVLSYRNGQDIVCTPDFSESENINIVSMIHPLVKKPVGNDVRLCENLIITGSNASGKSTYIKGIGVNIILAQSIGTCLAESATIPAVDVLTSMAVKDDIIAGDSYYLAEIKYLKRIIQHINDDRMTVCIVDEILRGTNREERIAATVAILRHLQELNCIVIIASHDILITELIENGFANGHFSEHIHEKDIEFDYKFKLGVSRTTNAIHLLRYIGFPDTIVDEASSIVDTL